MIRALVPIRFNESSAAVANLHVALQRAGFDIAQDEVDKQQAGESTAALVRAFQKKAGITPKKGYLVDEATADAMNALLRERGLLDAPKAPRCWVRGRVRSLVGSLPRDLVVTAYDQDLRTRQVLGHSGTRVDGEYVIEYDTSQFRGADVGGPDLVLEVTTTKGQVLFESEVVFNAPLAYAYDIVIATRVDQAEYDTILHLVAPLLEGQNATLAALEENEKFRDVSFLAGETGIERERLLAFVIAQRSASKSLPAPFWFASQRSGALRSPLPPAEGWATLGDAADALRDQAAHASPVSIETGLESAVAQRVIATDEKTIAGWMRAFRDGEAAGQGGTKTPSPTLAVRDLLDRTDLPKDKHDLVIEAYIETEDPQRAVEHLRKTRALDDAGLALARGTLELHDAAFGDVRLAHALLDQQVVELQRPASLRRLARLDVDAWKAAVEKGDAPTFVKGATPEERRDNYAKLLSMRARRVYPTAAFLGDLERGVGPEQGSKKGKKPTPAAELARFLDANPTFELASTGVDRYMAEDAAPETLGLARDPVFVTRLKATQRLFKIAPSYEATRELAREGLHSAQQVYRMGKSAFVGKFAGRPGIDDTVAEEIFERAANTHAAAAAIVGELKAAADAGGVVALDSGSAAALAEFPNLANLFGSGDACECEHCRSIFGPAAYLAELLMFLEQRKAADGITSVKRVLLDRRPDIADIELTCANANTEIRYVDRACEVLEDIVAPWKLFDLPAALAADFAEGLASAPVRNAFATAATPVALSGSARVSGPDATGSWIVRDPEAPGTWRVRPAGVVLEVALLRQTRGTAEELAANPEYVNEAAYAALAAAHYPMALPFDLATEEVNAYLAKISVKRSTLMETFRGPAAPNNPTDLDIAAAHFGISAFQRGLIFAPDTAQQYRYWGEANNVAASAALAHVDTFLNRTGLSYEELQALLKTEFVNPGGTMSIAPAAGCDVADKRIQPLDENGLDRVHRFLRLWRKLGWKMWELDLVIRNVGIGKGRIDNAFLLQLYAFARVRDTLDKLSIEQACALFDRINVTSKFTGDSERLEPSLYERLFLDKRSIDKPDPAFAIAAVLAADVPTPPAGTPDIADHLPALLSATRMNDADLAILRGLVRPVADPAYATQPAYIDDKVHLGNLSFLHRHALVAKALRIPAREWARALYLLQVDPFASPSVLLDLLQRLARAKDAGLTIDELSYLLAADLSAKSAEADKAIAGMLTTLRSGLQAILDAVVPEAADIEGRIAALSAQLLALGWNAQSVATLALQLQPVVRVAAMPATFVFPAAISDAIPIAFDGDTQALRFRGLMTAAQRTTLLNDPSLAAVTALAGYQNAVQALFEAPREAMRFFLPAFRSALAKLPSDIQFNVQLSAELAAKVRYDAERRELAFFGVMTADEHTALDNASTDGAYRAAVLDLFNQASGPIPADQAWVGPGDDLASAAARLAAYIRATTSRALVVQQFAQALKLTPAVTEQLLANSALFGTPQHPLIEDYLDAAYVDASAAVDALAFPNLFAGYRWLHRVALVLRKGAATYADLIWLHRTSAQTGVLHIETLPLAYDATVPALASFDGLLDLLRLLELQHALVASDLVLFDVVDRLISDPAYTQALFAADVELLAGWPGVDVAAFTATNATTPAFPADYARVPAWDRLARAFDLSMRVHGGVGHAFALAAPTVTVATSQMLKGLLRGKYEPDQWLDIGKSVQDKVRHRKRDSLAAWLLAQPMPADAPSHKWENANDLYAYYLIDVEMGACMQTSRIVQASNAIQLFVQRAFMGLEPRVRVSVDVDDAWKQWQWMKAYRVWEANRRVFIHPENYALPELRRDKSELFRKLEEDLLKDEPNRDSVETAFLQYLEGLDEIAQLEIAGTYYQENTRTLHVFGRTPGSEPHAYYYRQFIDSRRWTAWSKVECDIKSDYLVPLVANDRLYLVWPEFREAPSGPGATNVPTQGDTNVVMDKPLKTLSVHLAVTELRSRKWQPKKVSQEPVGALSGYSDELDRSPYVILPLDFTWLPNGPFLLLVYRTGDPDSSWLFELAGCKGYPEPYQGSLPIAPKLTRFARDKLAYIKNVETPSDTGDALVPLQSAALSGRILDATPDRFRISYPQYMSQYDKWFFLLAAAGLQTAGYGRGELTHARRAAYHMTLGSFYDWFYADRLRTFFVQHELLAPNGTRLFYQDFIAFIDAMLVLVATGQHAEAGRLMKWFSGSGYRFSLLFNNFYHPLTCYLTKQLRAKGIDGLFARESQFHDKHLDFHGIYGPTAYVDPQYPQEIVDFTPGASYAQYNWELFYFAPLTIAMRLSANQKFEEAMRWFHYIFDPTGGHDRHPVTGAPAPAPQKYWVTQPFFNRQAADYDQQRIENLMSMLASNVGTGTPSPAVKALQDHITDWRRNPFDPHIVAQFRTVAYQKLTVMKYVDNLIAWGDQQFRLFTMESVNQATQLYVLAAEILGRRPRKVPQQPVSPETFNEIEDRLDAFSNAMVELENFVPALPPGGGGGGAPAPVIPTLLYFCIPQNDQLAAYYDRVEDRLRKLRHCLDIDGVPRSLSLFAPPIDPMAIIRAMAAGADLATSISALDAPLPHYRFVSTLQKANEFTNDVKALGAALLAALEKKDAEALSRLRQQQERAVLDATKAVKQAQIEEATRALEGVVKSREMVTVRRDYYASRPFLNAGEGAALNLNTASLIVHAAGAVADVLGGVVAAIPDFQLGASGFGGSPHVSAKTGGQSFSKAAELAARALYQTSTIMDKGASITSMLAGYQRRMDDWQHQLALASKELEQLDKQIAGAQVRLDNAQRELANHELQIENSKAIDAFFHDKYTRQELYDWMATQVSQTFFQSYQLAFDLARRAERCFRFELGTEGSPYIEFGYWDSLKSGLQSGERLQLGLRQLEKAYLDGNRREFECTKHLSLAQLNPLGLVALKATGMCTVDLPEEVFDLDYAGHYFRRIKSVSISIPAVAGPHTTVSCTLRLLRNRIRTDTTLSPQYEHNNDNGVLVDDERFHDSHVQVNAIATSNGQNDSGMFELNFRDERYLPFEGAGAISTWQIDLVGPPELRQFDYESISDAILHMRYTAREDVGQLKEDAIQHLRDVLQTTSPSLRLRRMFDLRRDFATEWHAFLHPPVGGHKTLSLALTRDHFSALNREGEVQVEAISIAARTRTDDEMKVQIHPPLGDQATDALTLPSPEAPGSYRTVTKKSTGALLDPSTPWSIRFRKSALQFDDLDPEEINECFLVVEYTLQPA